MKKTGTNQEKRNPDGTFKKGVSGNPKGLPKGQRNYATIYREALIRIAEAKHKTPEEIEDMIEEAALMKALKGHFKFSKDVRDRLHGKAIQRTELTGKDGAPLFDDEQKQASENAIREYLGSNTEEGRETRDTSTL